MHIASCAVILATPHFEAKMDYLPIVLKKGRPFLEVLSDGGCRHRALCPRGKLVGYVDREGCIRVHLLSSDEESVTVTSEQFLSCRWVLPGQAAQECLADARQLSKSELLAVSSTFDLYWYGLQEEEMAQGEGGEEDEEEGRGEEGEGEEGERGTVAVECLAVLKNSDLSAELRRLECTDVITSISPLGSSNGQVLLLVNTSLVLRVVLDREFGRLTIQGCFSIEQSSQLQAFQDNAVPVCVGRLVDCVFQSPLLFTLSQDGIVFVYNTENTACIGVVNTVEYCNCASGRQPESEQLLTSISTSMFSRLAVSPDLTQIAVSSRENHLLLVRLADYFQAFPGHYHPKFVVTYVRRLKAAKSGGSSRAANISREEEEDRLACGGLSEKHFGEKFLGVYAGHFAWSNRFARLRQSVDAFSPSAGKSLNFHRSSHLSSPPAVNTIRGLRPQQRGDETGCDLETVEASKKSWYQEPISMSMSMPPAGGGGGGGILSQSDFDLPFLTGMVKTPAVQPESSTSRVKNGTDFPANNLTFTYKNHCILPADANVLGSDSTVMHAVFTCGVVVAYYGKGGTQEDAGVGDSPLPVGQQILDRLPVTGVAVYRTDSQSYSATRLIHPSWLIPPSSQDQPIYLASQHRLAVATFNLSQEEFIGKVLMYGNASVAEEVCNLNRWDKCALPINALETALELRQLDTVAFFLRNREGDSIDPVDQDSSLVSHPERSPDIPCLPPLPPSQLDTAVQLLIGAIRRNHQEEHYCQFASQLLIMTLSFLTRLIKSQALLEEREVSPGAWSGEEGGAGNTHSPSSHRKRTVSGTSADTLSVGGVSYQEMGVALTDLTSHIQTMRSFLPQSPSAEGGRREKADARGTDTEEGEESFMDRGLTETWDKMSAKDVIRDALTRGCLPLAQAYLIQRKPTEIRKRGRGYGRGMDSAPGHGMTLADALDDYSSTSDGSSFQPHYDASLGSVLTTAAGFVLEALEKRGIKMATLLLTQMGMNVKSTLRHICFHTLNRQLRDFLAKELTQQRWLSNSEIQALEYLRVLESYYPLQSYDTAMSTHSRQHPRKMAFQSTVLPVVPGIVSRPTTIPPVGDLRDNYPETFGGDYTLSWETADAESTTPFPSSHGNPLYLQVPLCAVLQWDLATRQRMIFEGFVLSGQAEGADCERLVNREHIFDYYISHGNTQSALQFLMSRVPPLEDPTPCPSQVTALCSHMPHAMRHLRDSLLDELARHGVFISSELANLPSLLHRLGRVHFLFTHPHPLTKASGHMTSEGAVVSLETFHRAFLHYLIENRFVNLMYHYLDCYNLALDQGSISALGLDTTEQTWVETMLQYRMAALNPMDPTAVFLASLSCGHLLLSNGSGSAGSNTVMGMLHNRRTLMAIATLMFAPVALEEAMDSSNASEPWYVDSSVLRQTTAPYPTLQAAIFPPPPTTLTPAQSQDITVYQLLQGSVPFHISRLFKWQGTNSLALQEEASEGTHELPHFSSPSLAERHALTECLRYTYYLMRGQPSFAFANFVAAKLIGRSNSAKRIDRAVSRVYRHALQDFTNHKLTSSCAAFLEMLDRDSTLMRVDVQAALRISRHASCGEGKPDNGSSKHKKISSQFIQLYGSPEHPSLAATLLSQLEMATHHMILTAGVDRCGLEAEESWTLVQSFCHCHQLLPSLAFLTTCAHDSQWLPLLCHAQLHSIQPHKVLPIIDKHFSNPCTQEHLHLAIASMDTAPPSSPTSTRADGDKPNKARRRRMNSIRNRSRKAESLVRTQPDLRAKFYSKVGLQKSQSPMPPEPKPMPDLVEEGGTGTGEGTAATGEANKVTPEREIVLPIEEGDLPVDLFSALIKCQTHSCPWRAMLAHAIAMQRPLLAILAACYEQSFMVDCVCVWLYSTLGCQLLERASVLLGIQSEEEEEDCRFSSELQWRRWNPHDLAVILVAAMQQKPSPAAQFTLAFQYFDQNNPILSFLRFHEEFTLRHNYDDCRNYLQEMELNADKCSLLQFIGRIGDMFWVEQVASTMVSHMLAVCPTPFERTHLLRLLAEANFGDGYKCNVLDFKGLHQITEVLKSAGLSSDAAFTVSETSCTPGTKSLAEVYSVRVRVNSDHVLGLLLGRGQFDVARKYASIVGFTASKVTIKEAEHNMKKLSQSSYWRYQQARLNFWHQCNTSFQADKVDPESAAEFFESIVHAPVSDDPQGSLLQAPLASCYASERALLLAFALRWRRETNTLAAEQMREVEKEIWLSHIHATVEEMENSGAKTGSSPLPFLPPVNLSGANSLLLGQVHEDSSLSSMLTIVELTEYKGRRKLGELLLPDNTSVVLEGKARRSLSDKEGEAFDMMLGRLLNAGFISQARELAALFEHDSPDLTIVLCCIQLAQGSLTPDKLTEGVLSLVSARSPRRLSESLSFEEAGDSRPSVGIIRMMHQLSNRATYSQLCCSCIITCFKIAVALRMSYTSVITSEPFDIITQLLGGRLPDKYALAKKFTSTCNLDNREVAGFLSDCIAGSLQSYFGGDGRESPKTRVYSPLMTSTQFMELAQLCSDQAVFATHLLSMAKALSSSEQPTAHTLSIQVELLVRAHDCYTLSCCVDGIAEVLVVARQWAGTLVSGKHFSLMVRLLTGIGRFHEMSYIIGLLLEYDEFESLVHTGVEKEEQLRVALMDYLRKHHGNDHEKMQMVALKFGMFRELAKTREDQAKKDLRRIHSRHLAANNPETVKTLRNVFDAFRAAAKTYAHEDCLANAEHCYSLARLVALQLSVLQSGKRVINLDVRRVHQYMEDQPFSEALIVADAYKQCIWASWVNPLYRKVVLGGDFRYLSSFKSAFQLTPAMFQELASKYLHDRERPPEATTNMKKLLGHLKNLTLKRKLALELGLTDVLHSFSPAFDEGFLNDVARL